VTELLLSVAGLVILELLLFMVGLVSALWPEKVVASVARLFQWLRGR